MAKWNQNSRKNICHVASLSSIKLLYYSSRYYGTRELNQLSGNTGVCFTHFFYLNENGLLQVIKLRIRNKYLTLMLPYNREMKLNMLKHRLKNTPREINRIFGFLIFGNTYYIDFDNLFVFLFKLTRIG